MTFPTNARLVNVIQGEYEICRSDDVILSTILGSCVAVCMYDPIRKIGGLNHYLLPNDGTSRPQEKKYGAMAMELLINGLLRNGATRSNLKAKVYGGANITSKFSSIGARNVEFAFSFLKNEGFDLVTHSTGGNNAMRVHFHGASGMAKATKIPAAKAPEKQRAPGAPDRCSSTGEIVLF